ncbi:MULTISPECIES: HAD-IA family hydrolase [Vibrio]|uniref:HAD-IA family hydrolase n=2 Tax=Vibrio TaxID=662 RepID=A0A7X4LPL9_9VIBR|nr:MULTISPECIES: HAD-IA family hydrolase [Vibrio]MBF9002974.1 HAD-IA family hydrolase [Vibrio nitrifigilis]MZI95819.1 HAD-IA family hydrolase [Vibrio eleionomae]
MAKTIEFKAALFDLDGTLIDSLGAVKRSWTLLAQRNNLDPDRVMSVIHGRPARESLALLLADKDDSFIDNEMDWLETRESQDTEGTIALNGSLEFIQSLEALGVPWAIVTSGTLPVASARIKASGIPMPKILITAEAISKGKPDPEPYLLGASKLGVDIHDCIVFEDAPAGIESGKAAHSQVVAILSHYTQQQLGVEHAISALDKASVKVARGSSNTFEFSY